MIGEAGAEGTEGLLVPELYAQRRALHYHARIFEEIKGEKIVPPSPPLLTSLFVWFSITFSNNYVKVIGYSP